MEFDKYRKRGDYHWREYARAGSIYRQYVDGLLDWVTGERILDVGAGDGLIAHKIGAVGVELDETAVRLAAEHGIDVRQGDACALPFDDASFDVVFIGDVIEHLPDPPSALAEAHRVLVESGTLYVTTPPKSEPVRPYHYREYTPPELEREVEACGFDLAEPMFTRHDRIHARFASRR